MGEVYRAEDTNLKREVAIKVLPEAFVQDPERFARFEREAHVLASLNHPNIAAIHDLAEDQGAHFLVLELVEGEDLAGLLSRGPVPVEKALLLALQIAQALEAAHDKGIVHRDLKPANVMISPDGNVKVLDFGLAKAWEPAATADAILTASPTLTAQMTQAGVILGTPSYMSPEQARGQEADKRADIWSFGVVLWEMLAGQRLFAEPTTSDTLAAVLRAEPSWEALAPSTQPSIRSLLRHCLERDPKERLHDIADARIVIRDSLDGTDDAVGVAAAQSLPRRTWMWFAAALLAAALIGAALMTVGQSRQPEDATTQPPIRAELNIATDGLSRIGSVNDITISPDGSVLVFSTRNGDASPLFRRSLNDRGTSAIPGTEGGGSPTFSPDGRWVAFFADGKLKKVSMEGGTPETLCDASNAFGASWGPDDTIVFNPLTAEGLWRVPASGGVPQRLSVPRRSENHRGHHTPSFLPDGSGVLFGIYHNSNLHSLALLDLSGEKEYEVLLPGVSYAIYSPTGHLLYTREDGLYAVPFSLEGHSITGVEVPVYRDLHVTVFNVGHFALSDTGILVSLPRSLRPTELVSVDLATGAVEPLPVPEALYGYPRYSPDGKQIALIEQRPGATLSWLVDPQNGRKTRIGQEGNNAWPFWTPDGNWVTYISDRAGSRDVYIESADGGGSSEKLFDNHSTEGKRFRPYQWSQDGQILVGIGDQRVADPQKGQADRGEGIYLLNRAQPETLVEMVPPRDPMHIWGPALSPDGRWLAYTEDDAGKVNETSQIYVTPFSDGGRRWLVSTEGGRNPLWSPDGRRLYFYWNGALWAVDIQTEPNFQASQPLKLMDLASKFDNGDDYTAPNWDISPDGKTLLAVRSVEEGEKWQPPTHFDLTTGFFEELRRKVPTPDR
jgi:serine/threonine-protein kinase